MFLIRRQTKRDVQQECLTQLLLNPIESNAKSQVRGGDSVDVRVPFLVNHPLSAVST
jgi:hypothetical protein